MTREEKINTLKAIIQECEEYQWQRKETLFEIIKDLEQETVSKESYDHEYFLRKEYEIKIAKLEQQESCDDCVRRQTVLDILKDKWNKFSDANDAMQESIDTIKALPPVTAKPKIGHWIIDTHRIRVLENGTEIHDYSVHCDKCGYTWDYTTDKEGSLVSNFCPNCGAKMVE